MADARTEIGVVPDPDDPLTPEQERSAVRVAVGMAERERRSRLEAEARVERMAALVAKEREARVAAERRARAAEREIRAAETERLGTQGSQPVQRRRRPRVPLGRRQP